jgi:ferredoxin-nitrite reductase
VLAGRAAYTLGLPANGGATLPAKSEPVGPDAAALHAQDNVLAQGRKLADQEKFKRDLHPFDGYDLLKSEADKKTISRAARRR